MELGIVAVMAMFIVPAFIACSWMFGSNLTSVLSGTTPDRVKYVRKEAPAPASAAPLSPQQKASQTRSNNKSKKDANGEGAENRA